MSENDVLLEDENREDKGTPSKGIPKAVWYGVGGFLVILVIAALGVIFFGSRLFGGGDPIAEITPSDTMLYMSFDFLNLQSQDTDEILQVFQEMSHAEKMTLIESLDEYMADEFEMSFTDDVMPWVGQYGAFIITNGDLYNEDYEYMFVVEARNKGKADNFIEALVEKLEQDQDIQFNIEEKEGVMLYTHKDEYGEDTYIAREGSYIYYANSEDAIFDSVNLKKDDSLASTDSYKNITAELPDNRIALMYIGGTFYQNLFNAMAESLYYPGVNNLENFGWGGMGMSMAVEDEGLQFDLAMTYDEENLSDYLRNVLSVEPLPPETDKLVPENTFFYFGVNQSNNPYTSLEDNPFYSEDIKESYEMFEDQFGISIEEFLNMFTGEYAFALAPAKDGVLSELGELDLGFTFLASTDDEVGFSEWFTNVLDVLEDTLAQDMYMEIDTQDATIGDYALEELIVESYGERISLLYYGASNGYIIIGTSEEMLGDGLGGENSLADNETYQNTWKAFSPSSVPYMYVDLLKFFDFIKDNTASYTPDEIREIEDNLEKMPVIAMVTNPPSGYTQSFTIILFIETVSDN